MRLIDTDALIASMGLENAVKWGNKDSYQQNHSYSTMMLYEIKDAIDWAPTVAKDINVPGWISVKDRLPEHGQLVVVRHEVKGRVYSEVAHYIMNLWWLDWDSNGLELNAISWMPLPEPPKEDSDGHD